MDTSILDARIRQLTMPLIEEECLELVELRLSRSSEGIRVMILVDKEEGGVSLGACVILNKRITEVLEGHEVFASPYTVEVSSPGVDRELVSASDFRRCLGRRIGFFLIEPVEGKIEWVGILEAVGERSVKIRAKDKTLSIDLDNIHKARQIVEP